MDSYMFEYIKTYMRDNYVVVDIKTKYARYCNGAIGLLRDYYGKRGVFSIVFNAYGIVKLESSDNVIMIGNYTLDSQIESLIKWEVPGANLSYSENMFEICDSLNMWFSKFVSRELERIRKIEYCDFSVVDAREIANTPSIIQIWYKNHNILEGFIDLVLGKTILNPRKDCSDEFIGFLKEIVGSTNVEV